MENSTVLMLENSFPKMVCILGELLVVRGFISHYCGIVDVHVSFFFLILKKLIFYLLFCKYCVCISFLLSNTEIGLVHLSVWGESSLINSSILRYIWWNINLLSACDILHFHGSSQHWSALRMLPSLPSLQEVGKLNEDTGLQQRWLAWSLLKSLWWHWDPQGCVQPKHPPSSTQQKAINDMC